jgi:radical SAM PhpK family P-methyltransferase
MPVSRGFDCLVVGYNDPPFPDYERLIRTFGEDSEAYRDLHFSFVDLGGQPFSYVDLLNHVDRLAAPYSNGPSERRFESGDMPNLAAAYLTNYLRTRGVNARYVNLFQREKTRLREWLAERPLCVAITTTFYVLNFPVVEMVRFIREHNPETTIVVGGPLIGNHLRNTREDQGLALDPAGRVRNERLRAALADIGADVYVTDAQGEATLLHLVRALAAGEPLSRVPNIIYTDRGTLRQTLAQAESNPIDEVAIDWIGLRDHDLGPTLQTRTARSCAYSCAFCNYPERAGALSLASVATVADELETMRALGNVRNLVFIDDTFNVPLARFKDLCRLMIERQYGFRWFSYFRCSNADEEAFDLMAASGCAGVFLGIESGSPTVLKQMHKAARADQYARGIEALRKRNILTFGSFIVGFPGETDATVQETLEFIQSAPLDYWRAQMWYYERGTPIDRRREEFQIEGDGFVWSHATMDSTSAMNHIERMFFTVQNATWLPQWSFDFWILPYLLGKGLGADEIRRFTNGANRMLALDLASVPEQQRARRKAELLDELVAGARQWTRTSPTQDDEIVATF